MSKNKTNKERKGFKYKIVVWMSKKMISCEEASFLISKSLDTKLTIKEKINLRMHHMVCELCRRYAKQIKQLDAKIGILKEDADENIYHHLTPEQKDQLKKILEEESK